MRAFTSVPTRRRQMGGAFPLIPFLVSAGARVLPHIARLAPKAIQSVAKLFKGGRSATKAITSAAKSASKSAGKAAKSAGKKAKDLSLKAKNLKAKAKFKIRDNRYVQRLNAKMRRNKYRRMSSAAEAMVAGAAKKSKKKKLFSTLGKVATVATLASALPGAGSAGKKLLGLDSDSDSGQPPRGRGRSQQYYGSKRTASQAGLNASASALSGMPKKAYRSLAQAMYRPTTAPFKSRQYKQALMNYRYFGAGKKKKKKKQKKKKTGGRGKKPKKKKTGRVSMNVMRQLARRRAVKDVFSF